MSGIIFMTKKTIIDWCKKQNKDISMFTLEMHRELEGAE